MKRIFEKSLETTNTITKPVLDVRNSRGLHMEKSKLDIHQSLTKETLSFNNDRRDTSVRDLGISLGVTFGVAGLGALAIDAIVDGHFESLGYGSLAIGFFGAAVALREIKTDLENRE